MAELERLRAVYRQIRPAGTDHLADEQWERLACDDMDPAENELALDHILSCPECSQVYHGILALREEAHTFDAGAPRPRGEKMEARRPVWRGILSGLAAAAAVIAVVFLLRPHAGPVPSGRTGPEQVTLRGSGVLNKPILVTPLGALEGAPGALSWRPVEGARGYVVELLDGDGELLWKSGELTATTLPWPGAVAPQPGRYYWRVLAIPSEGGPPVASELGAFDLGVTAGPR